MKQKLNNENEVKFVYSDSLVASYYIDGISNDLQFDHVPEEDLGFAPFPTKT